MKPFPLSRYIVRDHSMEPAFGEFDRVLVYNWAKDIDKGSVIVFRIGEKKFIKRVKKLELDYIIAISDNKKLAKKEYRIEKKDIIGRVFLKY